MFLVEEQIYFSSQQRPFQRQVSEVTYRTSADQYSRHVRYKVDTTEINWKQKRNKN